VWPDVFVKKSPNDHKNGPSNPPTNFIQLKFCPNHWAIFSLNKNCLMLKFFAKLAKFFPIWSHWLSTKDWLLLKEFRLWDRPNMKKAVSLSGPNTYILRLKGVTKNWILKLTRPHPTHSPLGLTCPRPIHSLLEPTCPPTSYPVSFSTDCQIFSFPNSYLYCQSPVFLIP
jgi:hypothetical protein